MLASRDHVTGAKGGVGKKPGEHRSEHSADHQGKDRKAFGQRYPRLAQIPLRVTTHSAGQCANTDEQRVAAGFRSRHGNLGVLGRSPEVAAIDGSAGQVVP